jgi:predicted glutamine amidotransferase
MCRIVGYVGSSEEELQKLYTAFRQGSSCDPYLQKAGINFSSHKDGWGYVLFDSRGLHHYRTSRAVYEDDTVLPRLTGPIYAILHSRLGSDQTLNGHICAHPFAGATDNAVLFFAHNGGVNCDNLPAGMVDSEWAFGQILKSGSVEKALPLLMDRTKQNAALNLLILTVPRDKTKAPSLQYLNYYKTDNEGRVAYYQMYCADLPAGRTVVSSTIKDLPIKGLSNVQPSVTGKLLTL